jgi:predicted TIM-barrel fold metal-dependent hydrolase
VARLHSAYDDIWDQFRRITAGFAPSEQRALFYDNAKRFYRI